MRVKQNRKLFSSALVAALLLVTAGTLAAQDVRYNFMPRTDFSKYRTYKWVNVRGDHPDQIMDAIAGHEPHAASLRASPPRGGAGRFPCVCRGPLELQCALPESWR